MNIYASPVCSCIICRREISVNNLSKHYHSKSCLSFTPKFEKLKCCKYCNLSFENLDASARANHSRWCEKNPRSKIDKEILSDKTKNNEYGVFSEKARRKQAEAISVAHKNGKYIGSQKKALETKIKNGTLNHTDDSKEKCRIAALKSQHQRVCKKSHKFIDKHGREFIFESSWEDALAIRLDELNISWDRPKPIQYTMHDRIRHYFPDFYLPEFDLYLDPKNSYAEKKQSEKLAIVTKLINLVILRTLNECKNYLPGGLDLNQHNAALEER